MKYSEINEKKQRGKEGFPIQIYHVDADHPQYLMPLHWHRDWEFIRVLSGEFLAHLNNEEYRAEAGDVLIISGGTLHHGDPLNCVYECVVFDPDMLRKRHGDACSDYLRPLLTGEAVVTNLPLHGDPCLQDRFDLLFDTLQKQPPFFELTVQGLLLEIFGQLYGKGVLTADKSRRIGHRSEVIISLVEWIDAHYAENITLEGLAEIAGMNEKYLCRIFKEFTGTTPIRYVNRLRIEIACTEMAVRQRRVTEAALESGFNDLSYFSRTFRQYRGCSPTEYRRQLSEPASSRERNAVGEQPNRLEKSLEK